MNEKPKHHNSAPESENHHSDDPEEISPFVKSMMTGVKIPPDFDYKKSYGDYLAEKY